MGTLVWALLGVVAVVIGVVLLFVRRGTLQKMAVMSGVETSGAGTVANRQPGELVEVKGTLRCESPLTSELAQQTCVYFASKILREYEVNDRDSQGRSRTSRRSETVASNTQFSPFTVEDETGSVAVNAEGADVDAQQVMNKYESSGPLAGASLTLGGVTISTAGYHHTLGYRYQEHILVPDTAAYVLGVVQADGSIGAPAKDAKDEKFIISYRSEEALAKSLGRKAFWLLVGAIVTFVVAAGLFAGAMLFRSVGL